MSTFIYLIRKGDLYKINHTNNFDKEIDKIKPDEIIVKMEIEKPQIFEARLYRRYKKARLPGSDYFKLTDKQLKDCRRQLGENSQMPKEVGKEFSITATSSLILFILIFSISSLFNFRFLDTLSFSLLISSLSFWTLFLSGSFGGYDSNDLPLFLSWTNRIKALIFASVITTLSVTLISFK